MNPAGVPVTHVHAGVTIPECVSCETYPGQPYALHTTLSGGGAPRRPQCWAYPGQLSWSKAVPTTSLERATLPMHVYRMCL